MIKLVGGWPISGGRLVMANDQGRSVADRAVRVGDLHATICKAIGVDYQQKNYSPDKRPFRIVEDEDARPIGELFG